MRHPGIETPYMHPEEIERRSFAIIAELLAGKKTDRENEHVIKRCIHASADPEYADSLYFSDRAVFLLEEALKGGCRIVTDTRMAQAGINGRLAAKWGVEVLCFMGDADVAEEAAARGIPRAVVSMEKAMELAGPVLFAVGNAPTILLRLYDAITRENYVPCGIVAVPVGFVNVVESKELILRTPVPCIAARGRKGGSSIAAAVCNALLLHAGAGAA
jgi:precorrin-8X/cobalt-precorrin-8 methylmutase